MKYRLHFFISTFIIAGILGYFVISSVSKTSKDEKEKLAHLQIIKPVKAQRSKTAIKSSADISLINKPKTMKKERSGDHIFRGEIKFINEKNAKMRRRNILTLKRIKRNRRD